MPMAFVRCSTGNDGQSHFEDLDLLPPDMERSIEQAARSLTFTRSPNGRFSDWHNAPRRQYAIFLSGGGYPLKAGQLEYDCCYSKMHGMPVTGGRGFRGLKPLWYNGVPP